MFIRYNNGTKYYEYDTSAAQNGSGPWAVLPLDGHFTPGTVPPNVALLNRSPQVFVSGQAIDGKFMLGNSTGGYIVFYNPAAVADARKWHMFSAAAGHITLYPVNDPETAALNSGLTLDRAGNLVTVGNIQGVGLYGTSLNINGNNSVVWMLDPTSPVNGKNWRFVNYSDGQLRLESLTDANVAQAHAFIAAPSGITSFPNYTVHSAGAYFPTTTSNPGLLDRYEEGTWAPTVISDGGGGATTYTTRVGTYLRIGSVVHLTWEIVVATANWSDGNYIIADLPFICRNTAHGGVDYIVLTVPFVNVQAHLPANSASISMPLMTAATTTNHAGYVRISSIPAGGTVRGNITYRTDT